MRRRRCRSISRDGLDVVVHGRLELYPPRGALQLVVERMEPHGLGALRLAFEQLKDRLAAEGLFAAERKRPLPRFPRTIGIVTALPGAAIHDMLTTLRRRWPAARVVVRPVRVQGAGAARDIADGIADLEPAARCRRADRRVAAAARSRTCGRSTRRSSRAPSRRRVVPVVSGVGHEIDFTIADLRRRPSRRHADGRRGARRCPSASAWRPTVGGLSRRARAPRWCAACAGRASR